MTAYDGSILGPIAKALGWIMDKIYLFFSNVMGVESVALTIVVFTVFIYLCLLPLTYKQQQFSVLTRKMQPEINAVQAKYKGKKDQASMQAQQEETQMIYDKYGVSPMGSCVQMAIQMPILFALYRVFYNVPAYIGSVKSIFTDLVNGIMGVDGYAQKMDTIYNEANLRAVKVDFTTTDPVQMKGFIIDVVYKLSDSGWDSLKAAFSSLSDVIATTQSELLQVNYLFGLNISDTPWNQMKASFFGHEWLLLFVAALIPLLSLASQYLTILQMPTNGAGNDQMTQQMRTMNLMMPLMSFFITFTVPAGLGLYWLTGGFIRAGQQFLLNRHFDKIDLDDIIEKNKEKAQAKKEKRGVRREQLMQAATMNTRKSLSERASIATENEEILEKAAEYRNNAKPGSLAAKANLVREFNEGKKKD
ncbi:MAG: YidC/Oxa1 family membrane protein insertase [Lachnospiraceae bacterium]|nr:YidC/Oxa1 family membrane protein insertase [Lachnospiraceae bacterium]